MNPSNICTNAVRRVTDSRVSVQSRQESLVLLIHGFFLECGFVNIYEEPSNDPRFAPTIKEIPRTSFIASGWNADVLSYRLMYKNKKRIGKQYILNVVPFDENVMVSLSQKNGNDRSVELNLNEFVTENEAPSFINVELLWSRLQPIIAEFIPELFRAEETDRGDYIRNETIFDIPAPLNPVFVQNNEVNNPFSVGTSDLFPQLQPRPIGAGGSSLVGPDHPMFNQPRPFYPTGDDPNSLQPGFYPQPPFLPGYSVPQPRFDPIYPEENFPGGVGFEGGRGRGINPGRGGRGAGRGRFPGEPNPDHLRPPGF